MTPAGVPLDADLATLAAAWPMLSATVRARILGIVEGAAAK